ncbi:MAG: hypothetical protein ACFE8F_12280 [Promethearchaeota archaeon]
MVKWSRAVQFMLYGMCFGVVIGSALWSLTSNAFFIFLAWLVGLLVGLVGSVVIRVAD